LRRGALRNHAVAQDGEAVPTKEGPVPGVLEGKRLLITGVLTDASLAFGVARLAQEEGAEIVLTGAGRGLRLTQRTARKLPTEPDVLELDVSDVSHPARLHDELAERWDRVDGALHAIGFAPETCLGGRFLETTWDDVAVAVQISAYSLRAVADAVIPLMTDGGSIVGLDFDARVAWPAYDWMGVAKAALESTSRYLARDLGERRIRVNLVAAGPVKTLAARSIPGFSAFEDVWDAKAPLGWDVTDSSAVAKACVALLSDWFPATTGELIHVDGGYHAMGA
jgi:enoyl-[acyl-carrier protein] reductase I